MAKISYESRFPINQAEDGSEEDCELPAELARLLEHEEKEIQPYKEPVDVINLGSETDKKEVKVGASLAKHVHSELVDLLREYVDVFVWSYQHMPGLDTNIVEHHLPLKPECPPVKLKLRRTKPDMALKIKEEVKKQLDDGFLAISEYPQYNQIKMSPDDMEKTTFITPWGTYCYKVMSFGLKSAGATYQRAMVTLFHDMIHEKIEVYVDDMITKSRTEEDHLVNLKKLFVRLRKFKLRLNPKKCTFGVRSANCEPIFKLLRKNQPIMWNNDCQGAFNKIKKYLQEPPILVPPVPGRPLIMYLTVLDESMGCVLGQHDDTGYQLLRFDFPDEDIMFIRDFTMPGFEVSPEEGPEPGSRWTLVFDGASNARGHGIGVVITSPTGFRIPFTARLCFDCTNNMAEYEACIYILEATIDLRIKVLEVFGDSALVISQVKGDSETRDSKLIPYKEHIKKLISYFDEISFHHISREENQLADALATLASMFKVKWKNEAPSIQIDHLDKPAHCLAIEVDPDDKPWFYDIKTFLEKQQYPEGISITDKKALRRLSSKFFLNGDVLYKRNYDSGNSVLSGLWNGGRPTDRSRDSFTQGYHGSRS
ncbi:uncharacterized protein LOC127081165 [Lathyrus oleraceus]|uniref:uncharacterized protein LOC127081165 n=1 Tax=Pisum sativum TaxID=3888 RepID=UPI0021D3487B|nr:uncharacterized protein LOC127081165 [Pisum sativum]